MAKIKLPVKGDNKDMVVSWIYTWSKQQEMSINEQRVILRIMEACQAELKGLKLKDNLRRIKHGLFDVELSMPVSDAFVGDYKPNDALEILRDLTGRSFEYMDEEEWWMCHFIEEPNVKFRSGIMTFRVSNRLWDVFMNFTKGYREFELNKALALPTGYALRFYMLMSGQTRPFDLKVEKLKEWLGISPEKYKDSKGKDRIDNLEERVIKPSKKALDESCPYTFNYVKVRENPTNPRSRVIAFRLFPVYQPQYRDEELAKQEYQAKITARYQLDDAVYQYLRYSMGFDSEEINKNKETFITAQNTLEDLIGELAILNGKARTAKNPKGWIIGALKGKVKDLTQREKEQQGKES